MEMCHLWVRKGVFVVADDKPFYFLGRQISSLVAVLRRNSDDGDRVPAGRADRRVARVSVDVGDGVGVVHRRLVTHPVAAL